MVFKIVNAVMWPKYKGHITAFTILKTIKLTNAVMWPLYLGSVPEQELSLWSRLCQNQKLS